MDTFAAFQILADATTQQWDGLGRPTTWQDVATIISGIATSAAVIVAVRAVIQTQRQICANEESAKQQRKDIEKQQNQLERQLAFEQIQSITSPFLGLLATLQGIVDSTRAANASGRLAFLDFYNRFAHDTTNNYTVAPPGDGDSAETRRRQISVAYRKFHRHNQIALAHYFRFLYNIVRYINDSSLDDKQKMDLIRILRAQLSQPELLLLFYNGLTDELGYADFFRLIRKYKLLHNLDKTDIRIEKDRDLYEQLPDPPQ